MQAGPETGLLALPGPLVALCEAAADDLDGVGMNRAVFITECHLTELFCEPGKSKIEAEKL